jgi:hypothetical protein
MSGADRVVRWSTAGAVLGVAAVAAVAFYEHSCDLVRRTVSLDSARRKTPVPALARWLLGLGIAATLAANVAHGLGHGLIGDGDPRFPGDITDSAENPGPAR